MASFRSEPRRGAVPGTKSADCPAVADLIDFADGRASSEDQRRVEEHLRSAACPHCRSWIARARPPASPLTFAPASLPAPTSPPRSVSPSWQREALDDLAQRLKLLEEP